MPPLLSREHYFLTFLNETRLGELQGPTSYSVKQILAMRDMFAKISKGIQIFKIFIASFHDRKIKNLISE